jgi:predicted alternative tryptophan synthase beta-subunit
MYRPSPLVRAYCLEEKLKTPAKIYYKFEGNNTSGSHKLNSAIAQAYYAKKQGLKGVTTETGAGQWGTALSMACAYLGLDCKVFMVKVSYEQKPFRREVMRTYGADVTPSPSDTTKSAAPFCGASRHHRLSGLRHLRGGGSRRPPIPATATCWAASSTRCCCTRASSVWRPRRRWINTA